MVSQIKIVFYKIFQEKGKFAITIAQRKRIVGELTWLKDAPREWNDKKYYYPIPESALLKNPKLGQNPGW